jgi:hypothetical protein
MALSKGVNSYAVIEDANVYFENRLDVAAWDEASDADKAKALITATAQLDGLEYRGYAVSRSQPLAFPRVGEFLDPRIGYPVSMSPVPLRVIHATYEQAYHLLNNDGLLDDTGSVSDLSIAGVSLNRIRRSQKISPVARALLRPLLASTNPNAWWRAN